jgi:hypothetical protein
MSFSKYGSRASSILVVGGAWILEQHKGELFDWLIIHEDHHNGLVGIDSMHEACGHDGDNEECEAYEA